MSVGAGFNSKRDDEARSVHSSCALKLRAKSDLLKSRQFVTIEDAKAALDDIDKQYK